MASSTFFNLYPLLSLESFFAGCLTILETSLSLGSVDKVEVKNLSTVSESNNNAGVSVVNNQL